MENEIVIGALVRKRAHLAGQIRDAEALARTLTVDLAHVDAALKLFNPAIELKAIKPVAPRVMARYGDLSRSVTEALREATEPLTNRHIVVGIMAKRGLA